MKRVFCFVIIALMILTGVSIIACAEDANIADYAPAVSLRAGGGGSGGSGGGGSGSGGSSSDGGSYAHSDTGQPQTLFNSVLQFILMPFVLFSSSIIFFIRLTKRSRKSKKLIKQIMQRDSAWKYEEISAAVNDGFYAIQTAWSNMDMTAASQYLSDELCGSFQTKLNWMKYRNQRNILKNISLVQALPVAVHNDLDNSHDYIWFYIKGKMIDYTIDTNTQEKIEGSTLPAAFVEYWQFVRKENSWVLNKILQKDESERIPFSE